MAFQLSPGVSITEKDVSLIIPAVASTGGGIVSPFKWGPAEEVTLISSEKELASVFGTPINSPYGAQFWLSAANFLSYGNNLKVVRFVTAADLNAAAGTALAIKNSTAYKTASLGNAAAWVAKYPGALGNSLKVVILDYYAGDPGNSDSLISLDDYADHLDNFDAIPGTSTFAVQQGNSSAKDEIHILVIDEDGLFTGTKNTVLERFAFVSKAGNALKEDGTTNYYMNIINNESQYIWFGNHTLALSTTGTAWGSDVPNTGSFKLLTGGGIDRVSLAGGADTTFSSITHDTTIATTYDTYFGDADTVDVSLLIAGPLAVAASNTVIQVAEARKDCMAFVSPILVVSSNTAAANLTAATTFRSSLTASSYGVMDSGTKLQYDKYNDVYRYVPLCGDIAGCCVRTDLDKDPWYSPAGFDRGRIRNAIKLAYNPNKTHRDELYKKSINPVVQFDGSGVILFGDKTLLQKPSAFDRINVRRLFIILEKAIATAAKFLLFEFNDEFTRSQFGLLVEPFLRDVQGRRGITDFKVVCNETNNTPQVIDSNNFVADIYIKPTRSINFIQLNFVATATGLSFEEVVGS